jgi:membrane-associated phospholipid phosphatase
MATANHYLLDVVGGVAVAVAGTWIARMLDRRRDR